MEYVARALQAILPVAWTAAAAAYLVVFCRPTREAERWCGRLAALAVVLNVLLFAAVGLAGRPMVASSAGALASTALAVAGVHLILERRVGTRAIGIFPVGMAVVLTVASSTADLMQWPTTDVPPWSTGLHVLGAVFAYSGLLLAALYGALFLIQRHALRARRFGLFWERLPSLELLDQFSWHSLIAAAIFLTFTIGLGHRVGRTEGLAFEYYDPKVWFTNLIWLSCVLLVISRGVKRLRPATSAWISLVLFLLAVSNMFIVDRFSEVHPTF
jgi:ABC-type uncharacterized transport system permease subunit